MRKATGNLVYTLVLAKLPVFYCYFKNITYIQALILKEMDRNFKKILPENVFVTGFDRASSDAELWNGIPEGYNGNRPTGNNFMDIFVDMLLEYRSKDVGFYADEMGVSRADFTGTIRALSGITPIEWINRYMMLVADELIRKDPGGSMVEVANQVGYKQLAAFVRTYYEHFKRYPGRPSYRRKKAERDEKAECNEKAKHKKKSK